MARHGMPTYHEVLERLDDLRVCARGRPLAMAVGRWGWRRRRDADVHVVSINAHKCDVHCERPHATAHGRHMHVGGPTSETRHSGNKAVAAWGERRTGHVIGGDVCPSPKG